MAFENFNLYTEIDEGNEITRNFATCSWIALDRSLTSYVYKDYGVGFFTGGFTHKFEIQFSNKVGSGGCNFWQVANDLGSWADIVAAGATCIVLLQGTDGDFAFIRLVDGSVVQNPKYTPSAGTTYYITIVENASDFTYVCTIRTGSHAGSVVATLTVNPPTEYAFRYIYAVQSFESSSGTIDGFLRNLDLGFSKKQQFLLQTQSTQKMTTEVAQSMGQNSYY